MFRRPLNAILWLDAASCAGLGLLLALASGPIAGVTGLPAGLLLGAGLLLLPVALLMATAARMRPVPRWLLLLIVDGNVAWVLASLIVLIAGLGQPTGLGVAFVLAQAAAVAVLAALEARGLRAGPAERAAS
jgi:hypothetical protein